MTSKYQPPVAPKAWCICDLCGVEEETKIQTHPQQKSIPDGWSLLQYPANPGNIGSNMLFFDLCQECTIGVVKALREESEKRKYSKRKGVKKNG
jgi:hypothetical protein